MFHDSLLLIANDRGQFAGPNEITMGAKVIAGPTNSVVIDKQGMYWMAGKVRDAHVHCFGRLCGSSQWKNTGDGVETLWSLCKNVADIELGSAGQPYSSFRYFQEMM